MGEPRVGLLGWATESLVTLDALAPGLLRRVLTASPLVRQAIFTVLASRMEETEPQAWIVTDDSAELARVLRDGRAREILTVAFVEPPRGLRGALARLGSKPMGSIVSYHRLLAVFTDPAQRKTAKALRHVGKITENMICILPELDDRWVHAQTLKRLRSTAEARDFNHVLAIVQRVCSFASDEAIVEAFSQMRVDSTLAGLVESMIRRAECFPSQPAISGDDVRVLGSASDIHAAGRRLHNCLISKLEEVIVGKLAYAEFKGGECGECILEFRKISQSPGWILWKVYIEHNLDVPRALIEAATSRMAELGIPFVDRLVGKRDLHIYRRFGQQNTWSDFRLARTMAAER